MGRRQTKVLWADRLRLGFAQKILGGHRPPLQLGVRYCRGALWSCEEIGIRRYSPPCVTARRGGCVINKTSRSHRSRRSRGGFPFVFDRKTTPASRSVEASQRLCKAPSCRRNHERKNMVSSGIHQQTRRINNEGGIKMSYPLQVKFMRIALVIAAMIVVAITSAIRMNLTKVDTTS